MKSAVHALSLASLAAVRVGAFAPCSPSEGPATSTVARYRHDKTSVYESTTSLQSTSGANDIGVEQQWKSLTEDGAVTMSTISSPPDDDLPFPVPGKDDVTVEYVGTIVARNWTAEDVVACWLPDQGLSKLAPELFRAFDIDGARLANKKKFNNKFVREGLGVLKDAKIDTLLKAAEDLTIADGKHREGAVFDKNRFTFRIGKGMSIPAFELVVPEMKAGQTASLVARCDYAYGCKGLRGSGKFLVPPYATVQYDLTLVEIK
ncbi:hypothetical protein ACHAXT_009359 [Thalassiosira profunda]